MNIRRLIKQGQFKFEQNKGLIFTILAGTFEVAAIIAMAKQAPKAEKILAPANKKIEVLKADMNDEEKVANHQVYVEDNKKAIRKIQTKTFIDLAKVYALPIIFTGLSLTFMGGSYKVMRDRELALGAAYVTLDNAYKAYRNRVKEKFGEEAENELFKDIREKKITRKVENPETGELEEIEETIKTAGGSGDLDIMFDATSLLFSKNGKVNYETLTQKERELTRILRTDGVLWADTVLDILGIPRYTLGEDVQKALRIMGWLDTPNPDGSPKKVLLGINDYNGHPTEVGNDLLNSYENSAWLTPNFDGIIIHDFTKHVKN